MIDGAGLVATGARVGAHIGAYALQASLGKLLIKDDIRRKRFFIENISRHSRRALDAMNIEVEAIGLEAKAKSGRNHLLVSNHLSYLDILCLSSVWPCMFVTSVDMGEVFFLGTMAELGGSLFIERRHRGQIGRDLNALSGALRQGFDVVIYPEGTSGNGETVLPFKKSLLMSAVEAGVDLQPLTIKYTEIDGEPFSEKNRDKVCWYGDMTFAPHFAGLLTMKSARVTIEFLEPIPVTPESSRHVLAHQAYGAIFANYTSRRIEAEANWPLPEVPDGEPPGASS